MQKTNELARVESRNTAVAATIFLFPAIALIIIYMIYPVIDTFLTSQYTWNGISADRVFVGLDNWKTLLNDRNFWSAFGHNVVVMIFSILLTTFLTYRIFDCDVMFEDTRMLMLPSLIAYKILLSGFSLMPELPSYVVYLFSLPSG